MDVMTAFPRSLFSQSEMEVARWFAARLGSSRVPSVQQVTNHRHEVLAVAGASPTLFEGKLAHHYSMLDLGTILKHVRILYAANHRAPAYFSTQEFSNPHVRPHLQTFAEDADGYIEETFQAQRWLSEVDADFAGPMVRAADSQDYFVHEPALAYALSDHVEPVLPTRWFRRNGEY